MTPSPYHNGKPCDLSEFYANVKCHVYYQNAFQSHTYTVSYKAYGVQPVRLLNSWDFPGKNTGMDYHFLLQGIFPMQGSNPGFPHCKQTLLSEPPGKPIFQHIAQISQTSAPRRSHFPFIHKSQQLEPLILLLCNLFQVVFVHSSSGRSNRILWTGWLLNNRNLFLTGLESGNLRSRCLPALLSGESSLPGSQMDAF